MAEAKSTGLDDLFPQNGTEWGRPNQTPTSSTEKASEPAARHTLNVPLKSLNSMVQDRGIRNVNVLN